MSAMSGPGASLCGERRAESLVAELEPGASGPPVEELETRLRADRRREAESLPSRVA